MDDINKDVEIGNKGEDFTEPEEPKGLWLDNKVLEKLQMIMNDSHRMREALDVANNLLVSVLIATGGNPIRLDKDLIMAVVTEPKYTFDIAKQDDGSLVIDPREMTDAEVAEIRVNNGNQASLD